VFLKCLRAGLFWSNYIVKLFPTGLSPKLILTILQ
jgi:hypothetical protein